MKNKYIFIFTESALFILLIIVTFSCTNSNNKTEKHQKKRDYNIVNIKDKIVDMPDIIPVSFCTNIKIFKDFLVIMDSQADSKGIYLYDKKTFKHMATTGFLGKGPGEIVRYGNIVPIENENAFYLPDFGKRVITKFYIDSILNNNTYKPEQAQKFGRHNFATNLEVLDDSIFLGMAVTVAENHTFRKYMVKYNIKNNEMKKFGYHHPLSESNDRKKTYFRFKIDRKANIYIKCYSYSDLITICNLNGTLKYNIYGPNWKKNKNNKKTFFSELRIYNNCIIAPYLGDNRFTLDEFKRPKANYPTKFLVFDTEGNYKQTIETEHKITKWCVDEDNKRIIAYFEDRDVEFGYFNIDFLDNL